MMKIDKVLEAHGIGIVQLTPPVPTTGIVTNGLVGYWNSKRGINGGSWGNIAPATQGRYDASLFQTTVRDDGMYFNGSTSYVQFPIPTELKTVTSATFEMRVRLDGGVADMVTQNEGREIVWIAEYFIVLSGMFDADKFKEHKWIYGEYLQFKDIYLTITADLTTNKITGYLYYPDSNNTFTDFYTTTIGTLADGDFVWLSGNSLKFAGILDSIKMYNRVLTQEEIIHNWSVGADLGI